MDGDLLRRMELYLARRDGVDKLLKIARYASRFILASSLLPPNTHLQRRLASFESSVGISRKAFRLGKFLQDLNALRSLLHTHPTAADRVLAALAHSGEGFYYFLEQFIWLAKSGLISDKHSANLQKLGAWAEFVGYLASVFLKSRQLQTIALEHASAKTRVVELGSRGEAREAEYEMMRHAGEKKMMKQLSILQDVADGLIVVGDLREGRGFLSGSLLISSAGLVSALICAHKNWVSC